MFMLYQAPIIIVQNFENPFAFGEPKKWKIFLLMSIIFFRMHKCVKVGIHSIGSYVMHYSEVQSTTRQ